MSFNARRIQFVEVIGSQIAVRFLRAERAGRLSYLFRQFRTDRPNAQKPPKFLGRFLRTYRI